MNDKHDKSKNPFFDNNFVNVDFSITIAYTEFKFPHSSHSFGGDRVSIFVFMP